MTSPVTNKLYELQTEESKQQEQEVSYGVAYNVAAAKAARAVRVDLDEQHVNKAGTLLHYALGVSWAPAYILCDG